MSDTTISPASKFYNNNKDKILAYKKQYYQEKNKGKLFLKHFKITGLSKRDSNNIIKHAYDNNLLSFEIENTNNEFDYETESHDLDSIMEKYNIKGILNCESTISNEDGEGSLLIDLSMKEILEMLDPDDKKYKLKLIIYNQIKIK